MKLKHYLLLSFLSLIFITPLFSRTQFKIREQSFENTRLGPVLARAAYMQTYEYHIQDPIFTRDYEKLTLWISFRGDLRFFAIFDKEGPLVVGIRSHRPDALNLDKELLREFVAFDLQLSDRKFLKSFLLREPVQTDGNDSGALEKSNCSMESQWAPPENNLSDANFRHPEEAGSNPENLGTGCPLPSTMKHWLEFIRNTTLPEENLDKSAKPA